MTRGGWRPNSGRKPGSKNRRTQEIVELVARSGKSPLETLLYVMNEHLTHGRLDSAARVASWAAPFCHSTRPVAHIVAGDNIPRLRDMSMAQLERLALELRQDEYEVVDDDKPGDAPAASRKSASKGTG